MKQNNPLHCHVLEKIRSDVLRKCYFLLAGNSPENVPSAGRLNSSLQYEERTQDDQNTEDDTMCGLASRNRQRGDQVSPKSLKYLHFQINK